MPAPTTNLYGLHDTVAVLNALQAALQAVQWNNAPAFDKVDFFDMSDLLKALQEVFNFANRVCVIIHDREHFESEKKGNELHVRQTRTVGLIIADRNIGNRKFALMGGDPQNKTAGALSLKDAVLNGIIGLLPGQPGILVKPDTGEQMLIQAKVRDELQGRVAFTLQFTLEGGNAIFPIGRQPIV
jgi:hypothetical protein